MIFVFCLSIICNKVQAGPGPLDFIIPTLDHTFIPSVVMTRQNNVDCNTVLLVGLLVAGRSYHLALLSASI